METYVQRSIKHCLNMIAPLEISDMQIEASQSQFYQFMVSIYQGMYEEPEKFFVFPTPYEEYIERSMARVKTKEKEHINYSRESTLRNTFQQAIQFYAVYLYNLGLESNGVDEQSKAMLISKNAYLEVLKDTLRKVKCRWKIHILI